MRTCKCGSNELSLRVEGTRIICDDCGAKSVACTSTSEATATVNAYEAWEKCEMEPEKAVERIGSEVLDYIISANLVSVVDGVCVWTANANEQIGCKIKELEGE